MMFGLLIGFSACRDDRVLNFMKADSENEVESLDETTQKPEATPKQTTEPTPEPTPELPAEPVLVIESIMLSSKMGITSITAVDENGAEIKMSTNFEEWFYGETSNYNVVVQVGSGGMTISNEDYPLKDDGSKLIITIIIDGTEKDFSLMIGSRLSYSYDDGGNIKVDINDIQEP
jgi:hypothetical protein